MGQVDTGARAQFTREDIKKKIVTLRRLREERLLIRPESAPHLRRLLDERIETVARELANALPDAFPANGQLPSAAMMPAAPKRRRTGVQPIGPTS